MLNSDCWITYFAKLLETIAKHSQSKKMLLFHRQIQEDFEVLFKHKFDDKVLKTLTKENFCWKSQ